MEVDADLHRQAGPLSLRPACPRVRPRVSVSVVRLRTQQLPAEEGRRVESGGLVDVHQGRRCGVGFLYAGVGSIFVGSFLSVGVLLQEAEPLPPVGEGRYGQAVPLEEVPPARRPPLLVVYSFLLCHASVGRTSPAGVLPSDEAPPRLAAAALTVTLTAVGPCPDRAQERRDGQGGRDDARREEEPPGRDEGRGRRGDHA